MKTSTLFAAASFALSAFAAPVDKRDQLIVVYGTATTEVFVTEMSTVWVDEPTSTAIAAFYEAPATTSTTPVVAPTSAPPVAVAQVVPNTPVTVIAPASTSTPVAAPAPTTSSIVQAAAIQSAAAPVPAAASPSSVSNSGSTSSDSYPYTGDITYYDVSVGLSSCGLQGLNSQDLVALSPSVMANGVNPNNNPKCGQKIEISYGGNTHVATVFDTCPGCSGGSIDLTQSLFQKVAPNGDGRVHDVQWRFM